MEQKSPPTGGSAGQKPETPGLLDDWMTRDELAGEIEVSVDTLSRWETRRIGPPCVRVGRKVYYSRSGFNEWMREQEQRAAGRTKGAR